MEYLRRDKCLSLLFIEKRAKLGALPTHIGQEREITTKRVDTGKSISPGVEAVYYLVNLLVKWRELGELILPGNLSLYSALSILAGEV